MFDDKGELTYTNRYVIRESHTTQDTDYLHNDSKIFRKFIKEINSEIPYNKDATTINALVILSYHKINNEKTHPSTNIDLFSKEMRYLFDNGFKVVSVSDLAYDKNSNYFYLKN